MKTVTHPDYRNPKRYDNENLKQMLQLAKEITIAREPKTKLHKAGPNISVSIDSRTHFRYENNKNSCPLI